MVRHSAMEARARGCRTSCLKPPSALPNRGMCGVLILTPRAKSRSSASTLSPAAGLPQRGWKGSIGSWPRGQAVSSIATAVTGERRLGPRRDRHNACRSHARGARTLAKPVGPDLDDPPVGQLDPRGSDLEVAFVLEEVEVAQPLGHATDPIHFDIEDRLKLRGLFYDRRKGECRQQRKPVDQLVSITALAQAVIAILLQRPDDARARPGPLRKREETYRQIFEENHNRDIFVSSILIDRQVLSFSRESDGFDQRCPQGYPTLRCNLGVLRACE
jgi:AIPR protein